MTLLVILASADYQATISDAGACCWLKNPGDCMFVQVKALKNFAIDFLPRCWILKINIIFLTMYQNCLY